MTTPHTPTGEHQFSTTDLAAALGVSSETIRRWSNQGLIPHIRTPGGHRRYSDEGMTVAIVLLTAGPGNDG